MIYGELIFNNGLTVPISIGYQLLFNKVLNHPSKASKRNIVFSVDQSAQTLTFSSKVNGIKEETAEVWVKECEKDVLSKKKLIITLLAVIGVQMDCEYQIMREILHQKKMLKNGLEKILQGSTEMEV